MSDLEFNKIFAAVLVAGILAMVGGFISKIAVHPEGLEENAYKIEVTDTGAAVAAGPVGPEPVLALLADADIEKGQKVAKKCMACHGFDKGGANKTGPNLYGIINADKASVAGFSYSDALKAEGGKWDYAAMNHWLWDPKDMVSGTKMNFAGLSKPSDRAALIAYMRSQADSPAPLPSAADIAAEMPEEAAEEMQEVMPEAGDEIIDEAIAGEEVIDAAEEAIAPTAEELQDVTPEAGTQELAPELADDVLKGESPAGVATDLPMPE